jgi:hypothetical protein
VIYNEINTLKHNINIGGDKEGEKKKCDEHLKKMNIN